MKKKHLYKDLYFAYQELSTRAGLAGETRLAVKYKEESIKYGLLHEMRTGRKIDNQSAYVDKDNDEIVIPKEMYDKHFRTQHVDNQNAIGWDKCEQKEEKEFDWDLNMKFIKFNGWRCESGAVMNSYCRTGNCPIYPNEIQKKLNYLEDPKLIQETIDNIIKVYPHWEPYNDINVLSRIIDNINSYSDTTKEAHEKAREKVNEAFKDYPKRNLEFWESVDKEHKQEIREAEKLAFEAGRTFFWDNGKATEDFAYPNFEDYLKSETKTEN